MFEEYPDIVTVDEMCDMLRCGKNAAYQYLNSGKIRAIRNGKKFLRPKRAVCEFVMANVKLG